MEKIMTHEIKIIKKETISNYSTEKENEKTINNFHSKSDNRLVQ